MVFVILGFQRFDMTVAFVENFLGFQLQDKHNASFFSNVSWRGVPQSKRKSNKKTAIITYLVTNFFACSMAFLVKISFWSYFN